MSKRRKKDKQTMSPEEYDAYISDFHGDMYQAPKGKKPRGRDKRKAGNHKTAYYD